MLQLIELTDSLFISGQPDVADVADLAQQGFNVVVCNRPDGEAPGQPSMAEMQAAVESAGMRFVGYPVNPATFPGDDLAALGDTFDSADKVFAYCRTGTRCANLWVATRQGEARTVAAERARSFGYDLSMVGRLG